MAVVTNATVMPIAPITPPKSNIWTSPTPGTLRWGSLKSATDGRGVDLILEMAAHINLDKDLGLLARNGRVVMIGTRGRVEIDPRQTFPRDGAILGMTLFNAGPAELAAMHMALVAGLENGALNPVVGRELPLADAPAAHEAVLSSGALGKIVLAA